MQISLLQGWILDFQQITSKLSHNVGIYCNKVQQHLPLLRIFKFSNFNRNACDLEFSGKGKGFPHRNFSVGSSWSSKFAVLTNRNSLVWRWLVCELCFMQCCTIDNRPFCPQNFTQISLMWPYLTTAQYERKMQ